MPSPRAAHPDRRLLAATGGDLDLRTDAGDFDVLADIPDREGRHLGFEDLAPRAASVSIGDVAIRIAALEDVIASKEWADRPKDRDALPELRAIYQRELAQRNPRSGL